MIVEFISVEQPQTGSTGARLTISMPFSAITFNPILGSGFANERIDDEYI